jgi:hypothetical protein
MQTAELVALPLTERLMAMEVLWESLCREPAHVMLVPDWHQDELAQRVAALHDGTATVARRVEYEAHACGHAVSH